ncbi:hypothetical protein DB346_10385 [Verrucomicrobia bacterium LW23]|nr:hypothetical protein DB346_10385 [Verrucomicrobia bacterium LW23]
MKSQSGLPGISSIIWVDPDRPSGEPCFYGTRVPVQTLLDNLEDGCTIDEFLEGFPSVSREQVIAFLELGKNELLKCVSC